MRKASSLKLLPCLFAALAACSPGGERASESRAAPSVEVVDLAGLDAALAARRGQGYLLNFWAIWCAPCVAELPDLAATERAWRERGGAVLTVNYDLMLPDVEPGEVAERVRAFSAERGFDFPVYVYRALDYDAINERFELPGEIPVTLAIDKDGRIVDRQEGSAERERFEELMAAALR